MSLKEQVCAEKCNCQFIQSCAAELDGVIPDVHQRCNRDQTLAFSNGNHIPSPAHWPSSLHPSWKRVLCVWSPLSMHLKEIREPLYVVQLVSWYYRLFCCAMFFFLSGHIHLRRRWCFFHHVHPIDVTGARAKKSLKKPLCGLVLILCWHLRSRHWKLGVLRIHPVKGEE